MKDKGYEITVYEYKCDQHASNCVCGKKVKYIIIKNEIGETIVYIVNEI